MNFLQNLRWFKENQDYAIEKARSLISSPSPNQQNHVDTNSLISTPINTPSSTLTNTATPIFPTLDKPNWLEELMSYSQGRQSIDAGLRADAWVNSNLGSGLDSSLSFGLDSGLGADFISVSSFKLASENSSTPQTNPGAISTTNDQYQSNQFNQPNKFNQCNKFTPVNLSNQLIFSIYPKSGFYPEFTHQGFNSEDFFALLAEDGGVEIDELHTGAELQVIHSSNLSSDYQSIVLNGDGCKVEIVRHPTIAQQFLLNQPKIALAPDTELDIDWFSRLVAFNEPSCAIEEQIDYLHLVAHVDEKPGSVQVESLYDRLPTGFTENYSAFTKTLPVIQVRVSSASEHISDIGIRCAQITATLAKLLGGAVEHNFFGKSAEDFSTQVYESLYGIREADIDLGTEGITLDDRGLELDITSLNEDITKKNTAKDKTAKEKTAKAKTANEEVQPLPAKFPTSCFLTTVATSGLPASELDLNLNEESEVEESGAEELKLEELVIEELDLEDGDIDFIRTYGGPDLGMKDLCTDMYMGSHFFPLITSELADFLLTNELTLAEGDIFAVQNLGFKVRKFPSGYGAYANPETETIADEGIDSNSAQTVHTSQTSQTSQTAQILQEEDLQSGPPGETYINRVFRKHPDLLTDRGFQKPLTPEQKAQAITDFASQLEQQTQANQEQLFYLELYLLKTEADFARVKFTLDHLGFAGELAELIYEQTQQALQLVRKEKSDIISLVLYLQST